MGRKKRNRDRHSVTKNKARAHKSAKQGVVGPLSIGWHRKIVSWLTKSVLGLATLAGVAYELRPQISTSAASAMNVERPFEPIISITNVGLTDLHSLTFDCFLEQEFVADADLYSERVGVTNDQNSDVGNNIAPEPVLHPQTTVTKTCASQTQMVGSHINAVIVAVKIDYRPSFWPFRLTRYARFKTRKDGTGEIKWLPDPKDDPYDHQ